MFAKRYAVLAQQRIHLAQVKDEIGHDDDEDGFAFWEGGLEFLHDFFFRKYLVAT